MNKLCLTILVVALLAGAANAAPVRERWAPPGIAGTHPDTLKVATGKVPVLQLDLSALPKDAQVYRATLRNKRVSQPKDPIEIRVVAKIGTGGEMEYEGQPLALEAPGYASYDLTALVPTWQQNPARNQGLALVKSGSFDPASAYVDICYEGTPQKPPPQVSNLKAVHHDGQTFLTWKEMVQFQPAADKTFWVANFSRGKVEETKEPGKGFLDLPRMPCIRQGELRRLQMFDITPPRRGTQDYPKYTRQKGWPDVCYRIYRSKSKITPANIQDAEFVGEADVLCAYDLNMIAIGSHGEYYDKYEIPENPIPTYCLEDGQAITPGEAFYVHTAQDDGTFFYGVTVVTAL
jgi:hypothetical protein